MAKKRCHEINRRLPCSRTMVSADSTRPSAPPMANRPSCGPRNCAPAPYRNTTVSLPSRLTASNANSNRPQPPCRDILLSASRSRSRLSVRPWRCIQLTICTINRLAIKASAAWNHSLAGPLMALPANRISPASRPENKSPSTTPAQRNLTSRLPWLCWLIQAWRMPMTSSASTLSRQTMNID
ncbi:hypothetical protein D3C73_1185620 [compost metagenome]